MWLNRRWCTVTVHNATELPERRDSVSDHLDDSESSIFKQTFLTNKSDIRSSVFFYLTRSIIYFSSWRHFYPDHNLHTHPTHTTQTQTHTHHTTHILTPHTHHTHTHTPHTHHTDTNTHTPHHTHTHTHTTHTHTHTHAHTHTHILTHTHTNTHTHTTTHTYSHTHTPHTHTHTHTHTHARTHTHTLWYRVYATEIKACKYCMSLTLTSWQLW